MADCLIVIGVRQRSAASVYDVSLHQVVTSRALGFARAQGDFTGLDQLNLAIPRSLAGRGGVDVAVRAEGKTANTVTVNVK